MERLRTGLAAINLSDHQLEAASAFFSLILISIFLLIRRTRALKKPKSRGNLPDPGFEKYESFSPLNRELLRRSQKPVAPSFTFRISDIPCDITEDLLRRGLSELISLDNRDGGGALAPSLAPSSSSSDSDRFQTATITLFQVPEALRKCVDCQNTIFVAIGGAEVAFDTNFLGLTPLNSDPNPVVDIVAVNGLAGHAYGSWMAEGNSKMWLKDFLAQDMLHAGYHTRILTYGYDSTLFGDTGNSDASIHEFARHFLEAVKDARNKPQEAHRPIIFIAHSLGGLVLKHALAEASKGDDKEKAIFQSCYAAFFFGVPNRGLENSQLITMAKGRKLVDDLGADSQVLPYIDREFQRVFTFTDAKIYSIYETKDTRSFEYNPEKKTYEMTGPMVRMVSRDSALYSRRNEKNYNHLSSNGNHVNMIKFDSRTNTDYKMIRAKISECVEEAPRAIKKRLSMHRPSA
ncbi:hypothetical protein EDC01DRAFT_671014 [Geopyxis carbonaria]|nr:hypothetical protein EDC01DRAFT_671014 [Geopyxis carbonaria]